MSLLKKLNFEISIHFWSVLLKQICLLLLLFFWASRTPAVVAVSLSFLPFANVIAEMLGANTPSVSRANIIQMRWLMESHGGFTQLIIKAMRFTEKLALLVPDSIPTRILPVSWRGAPTVNFSFPAHGTFTSTTSHQPLDDEKLSSQELLPPVCHKHQSGVLSCPSVLDHGSWQHPVRLCRLVPSYATPIASHCGTRAPTPRIDFVSFLILVALKSNSLDSGCNARCLIFSLPEKNQRPSFFATSVSMNHLHKTIRHSLKAVHILKLGTKFSLRIPNFLPENSSHSTTNLVMQPRLLVSQVHFSSRTLPTCDHFPSGPRCESASELMRMAKSSAFDWYAVLKLHDWRRRTSGQQRRMTTTVKQITEGLKNEFKTKPIPW